jgi:Domain of unknown function (DUF6970)
MMRPFGFFITVMILAVIAAGCASPAQAENPPWVDELIVKFRSEPVGNPPQSLWRYDYNGQTVYYIPPQCCDQYSQLLDASGRVICAPDGGFTGKGDGRCPDFSSKRTNENLVWRDSRSR